MALKFKTHVVIEGKDIPIQVEVEAVVGSDYGVEETNIVSLLNLKTGDYLEPSEIEDEDYFNEKVEQFIKDNAMLFYEEQLGRRFDMLDNSNTRYKEVLFDDSNNEDFEEEY